jgi:hypothetical protein
VIAERPAADDQVQLEATELPAHCRNLARDLAAELDERYTS